MIVENVCRRNDRHWNLALRRRRQLVLLQHQICAWVLPRLPTRLCCRQRPHFMGLLLPQGTHHQSQSHTDHSISPPDLLHTFHLPGSFLQGHFNIHHLRLLCGQLSQRFESQKQVQVHRQLELQALSANKETSHRGRVRSRGARVHQEGFAWAQRVLQKPGMRQMEHHQPNQEPWPVTKRANLVPSDVNLTCSIRLRLAKFIQDPDSHVNQEEISEYEKHSSSSDLDLDLDEE